MIPKEISKEEFLMAVRQGVYDAMRHIMYQGSDMPGADFFDSLKAGVEAGIQKAMPASFEIENAITKGVREAFPCAEEIANAIYGGAREGVQERNAGK